MNATNLQSRPGISYLTIKKSTALVFIALILYKLSLDISLYYIVSSLWQYQNFTLSLDTVKLFESYILLILVFLVMPKSTRKPSSIALQLLLLIAFVPILTIFAFKDESRIYAYATTGFWILVCVCQSLPGFTLKPLNNSRLLFNILIWLPNLIVLGIIIINFGLTFNFDLFNVYAIRSIYVDMKIPLAIYLFNWVGLIINPLAFAYYLKNRKWWLLASVLLIQLLLFSATGIKFYFFTLPFVFIMMLAVNSKNSLLVIILMMLAAVGVSSLEYAVTESGQLSGLITGRTFLLPAQISFFYYDFFSAKGPVLLSHSILRPFIEYPYDLSPTFLISSVYFNDPAIEANNGVVADAFMNFGFAGLLLYGILLSLFFKLLDAVSKGVDRQIGVAIPAVAAIVLSNNALLTGMWTNGLLIALLFLYLLPGKTRDSGEKSCAG